MIYRWWTMLPWTIMSCNQPFISGAVIAPDHLYFENSDYLIQGSLVCIPKSSFITTKLDSLSRKSTTVQSKYAHKADQRYKKDQRFGLELLTNEFICNKINQSEDFCIFILWLNEANYRVSWKYWKTVWL